MILQALNARGVRGIHVVAADGARTPRTFKALWAMHGWCLPYVLARRVLKVVTLPTTGLREGIAGHSESLAQLVQAQGGRFIQVEDLNGEDCHQALRSLHVDLMILGGVPIMRAPTLQVPRLGTINAHQGLLPRFRGVNMIEWALFEGYSPSISIHFVDPGVDTGDIIMTEPIPILSGDTLGAIRKRALALQGELLARTVFTALNGPVHRHHQRRDEGRQYYTMHPRLRVLVEQRLRECAR